VISIRSIESKIRVCMCVHVCVCVCIVCTVLFHCAWLFALKVRCARVCVGVRGRVGLCIKQDSFACECVMCGGGGGRVRLCV